MMCSASVTLDDDLREQSRQSEASPTKSGEEDEDPEERVSDQEAASVAGFCEKLEPRERDVLVAGAN
jgi:hypothetical protein